MAKSKFSLPLTILALAFCFFTFSVRWPLGVSSQLPPVSIAQIRFATPPESAPAFARREESRSRCPCYNSPQTLTALIPPSNLALTTVERPTFFFYIPHAATSKNANRPLVRDYFEVEFELLDEQERHLYQTNFLVAGTPGIISFTLPTTAPALVANKYYHWFFEVICSREDRSADSVVSGWTRRVELNATLTQELNKASPGERPAIYAKAGLWHDTITALAQLRRPQPDDSRLTAAWVDLLKSVELEKVAGEPLVNCCNENSKDSSDRPLILKDKPSRMETGC